MAIFLCHQAGNWIIFGRIPCFYGRIDSYSLPIGSKATDIGIVGELKFNANSPKARIICRKSGQICEAAFLIVFLSVLF